MKFVFYYFVCWLLLTVCFTRPAFGQIYNVNADTVVLWPANSPDSIYVFKTSNTGTIKARSTIPGANFQWARYDTLKNKYSTPLGTDSIASNLVSGGYQVSIAAGSDTFRYKAWVYIDKIGVTLEKDNQGNVKYYRYTCDYTDFISKSTHSNFVYYNLLGKKQALPEPKYRWWAVPEVEMHSWDNLSTLRLDTTRLPLDKAVFYVEAKDAFGLKSNKDSVKYSPIICKAIMDTTGTGSHPVVNGKNSAPFTAYFLNKSKNAVSYTWFNAKIDSISTNKMDKDSVTFFETGTFRVSLVAQSLEQCTDTAKMDIIVAKGQIGTDKSASSDTTSGQSWPNLPNVFVPGSTTYPYFKIYNISIRQFRFTVYSRWGKEVYTKEGYNMLDWDGWNGRIYENGPEASDGIYYYVLEVISYDKTVDPKLMNPKGKYSGFFYLFWQK